MIKTEITRIFTDGEHLEDWTCDYNPESKESESNGGKEHLIYDEETDKFYLITTDWENNTYSDGSEVDEKTELTEGGFVADIIKKFRESLK